ncbi:MAG TPA: chorismate lyase [Nitrospiria bacterium]|nr:chorismate lyase [Nitrospiria bacterium]
MIPRVIALATTSIIWKTFEEFLADAESADVAPVLRLLLASDGSMTTALEALRLGRIGVEVLRQGEEPIDDDTARRLGVAARQTAVSRHAWLTHAGERLLYAVSVLPLESLDPDIAAEVRRGIEPLGRLFDTANRAVLRDGLRIGRLHDPDLAAAFNVAPSETLWCRTYRLSVERTLTASIVEVLSPRLAE